MLKKDFADFKNVFKTAKGADIAKGAIKTLTGKAACALVALVLVIGIASAAGGSSEKSAGSSSSSGKAKTLKASESDFTVELAEDGAGVIITGTTLDFKGPTALVIPEKIQGMPVVKIDSLEPRGAVTIIDYVTSITVPETVKEFGKSCFSGYGGLESVNFPKSLEKVCKGAFRNTRLKKVTIKANIDWTEGGQFSLCGTVMGMDEVTIEEGVEFIPRGMFSGSGVKKIVIPASVKKIGDEAFAHCEKLEDVEFKSPNTALRVNGEGQQWVFNYCPKLSIASQAAIKKQPLYKD